VRGGRLASSPLRSSSDRQLLLLTQPMLPPPDTRERYTRSISGTPCAKGLVSRLWFCTSSTNV
jgi:hypothetical protein